MSSPLNWGSQQGCHESWQKTHSSYNINLIYHLPFYQIFLSHKMLLPVQVVYYERENLIPPLLSKRESIIQNISYEHIVVDRGAVTYLNKVVFGFQIVFQFLIFLKEICNLPSDFTTGLLVYILLKVHSNHILLIHWHPSIHYLLNIFISFIFIVLVSISRS